MTGLRGREPSAARDPDAPVEMVLPLEGCGSGAHLSGANGIAAFVL